jgi:hypothetical protein
MIQGGIGRMNIRIICILTVTIILTIDAYSIPYFARKYNVSCQACHLHPPKVNITGEKFAAGGYDDIDIQPVRTTLPFALWISGAAQNIPDEQGIYKGTPNRVELITADRIPAVNLSYFIEWRILSREITPAGTIRDRSGRFEDLFLLYDVTRNIQIWIGQYRALTQIDVSRRLSISEPLVFSQSLPGAPASSQRITSLRGFAPSGRSPSLRLMGVIPVDPGSIDGWYAVATVPFTGEFSIPLGRDARRNASFELEGIPKGLFLEIYRRVGISSIGVNYFNGSEERSYLGLVGDIQRGRYILEGAIARTAWRGPDDWRWSVGLESFVFRRGALGLRIDHRTNISLQPLLVPYISYHLPGTSWTVKAVLEGRLRDGEKPLAVAELSLIF